MKGINEQLISSFTFSSPHVISRPKAKPGCSCGGFQGVQEQDGPHLSGNAYTSPGHSGARLLY